MLRPLLIAAGLIVIWQSIIVITGVQFFILPSPVRVASALVDRHDVIAVHVLITLSEILLGLLLGSTGTASALIMGYSIVRQWLMPVPVISQAVPVFALAPILVLWLGYGPVQSGHGNAYHLFRNSGIYDGLRHNLGHLS